MELRQRLGHLHARKEFFSAFSIIKRLQAAGFEAVLAGGSVRDSLLGRTVKDLDIATSAPPEQVEALFARTVAVGKAFGTIVVIEDGETFEVTTFRREGPYRDGRHPEFVELTDMREDALRRDFTVNALFYDPVAEVVHDFVGGCADLNKKYLRTVGQASARFGEDHLRMLRAIRFVGQLGFALDPAAVAAISELRHKLTQISVERVRAEVERLLVGENLIAGLKLLAQTGLSHEFWPEIANFDPERLQAFPAFLNWENAYSAILFLADQQDPVPRLRVWKASRESQRRVVDQTRAVTSWIKADTTRAARFRILGSAVFSEVLVLLEGLELSANLKPDRWIEEFLKVANALGHLPEPFINGNDLLKAGLKPGANFGRVLELGYDQQLEGALTSRDQALEWLKAFS